jgi:hypothetical protein
MCRRTAASIVGCTLLVCQVSAAEGPVAFSQAPAAVRSGERTLVSFAVTRATDVAVTIEDARGTVLRHLAAGVLGTNAPKPFQAGSLAQTLTWDGKADWGRALPADAGNNLRVRVRLGLGAAYDRVVASEPETLNKVFGLGVGPDGTLYAASQIATHTVHNEGMQLVALNRDGTYRRTLIPVPSSTTREQLAYLGGSAVEVEGRLTPVVADINAHRAVAFWPDRGANMAVTADGLLLVPQANTVGAVPLGEGVPAGRYAGALVTVGGKPADFTTVVVSGDGQWAYACGHRGQVAGAGTEYLKAGRPVPAVYRVKLPARSECAPFFGDPAKAGQDESHLASPCGLALDGKGNLLIADRDNDRVVVVSEKDGQWVGSFPVDKPEGLAVDARSGAVYVLHPASKKTAELLKFRGWKEPVIAATSAPLAFNLREGASFVLDTTAGAPVAWVACALSLLRIEDQGAAFAAPVAIGKGRTGAYGVQSFEDVTVDRYRDDPEIYTRRGHGNGWTRFNETTEKTDTLMLDGKYIIGPAGTCIVPGPEGKIYALCQTHPAMFKFDRTGKALAWDDPRPAQRDYARPGEPKAEERYIQRYTAGKLPPFAAFARVCMGYMTHTMGVRPDGHIFVFERSPRQDHRTIKALYEFEPSGRRRDQPIIWMASDNIVGPKFDQDGNIYVAEQVRPAGQLVPPEYRDGVSPAKKDKTDALPAGPLRAAIEMYGSILKFGPRGGMIDFLEPKWGKAYEGDLRLDADLKTSDAAWCMDGVMRPARVIGAEWMRVGVSHVNFGGCNCEHINFDVDPFGRVWYPDIGRCRIDVLDSAGNEVMHFGGYGNADSRGPESRDPKLAHPDVALAWPLGVAVTDRGAYVGDPLNRRLIRARFTQAAESVCEIK